MNLKTEAHSGENTPAEEWLRGFIWRQTRRHRLHALAFSR